MNTQWMLREKDLIWGCVKLLLVMGSLLQCDLDSSNIAAGAKATYDLKNFWIDFAVLAVNCSRVFLPGFLPNCHCYLDVFLKLFGFLIINVGSEFPVSS